MEDCYEKKPARPQKDYTFSICKCGHYSHDHERHFIITMWLAIITLGHYGPGCNQCECSMYHFMGKYTSDQARSLKPCEDTKDVK